ncbi:MAG: PEP-utilizing enzyme [archaeon]
MAENNPHSVLARGACASRGRVEGIIHIASDDNLGFPSENDFILVCKQTNPAYSTLLMRSKGVIAEIGGIVSHAAIIARELEIPCIVGAENATQILKEGQKIVLDATNGVVYG